MFPDMIGSIAQWWGAMCFWDPTQGLASEPRKLYGVSSLPFLKKLCTIIHVTFYNGAQDGPFSRRIFVRRAVRQGIALMVFGCSWVQSTLLKTKTNARVPVTLLKE